MSKIRDLTGQKYGRLIAQKHDGFDNGGGAMWECICDCGNTTRVLTQNLTRNHTQSCGCLQAERRIESHTIHGLCSHPLYDIWRGMKSRCSQRGTPKSKNYGDKGISVCERWRLGESGKHGFLCFLEDMGDRPSDNYSIDRIDNSSNYEPGNVRWATAKTQAINRTSTRWIEVDGVWMSHKDAAKALGIDYKLVSIRINKLKWSIEEAFAIPVGFVKNREEIKPPHRTRKNVTLGNWVDALLLQAKCPDCGEILGDKGNCQYDHNPALDNRRGEKWFDIHPNDPRFVEIRHIQCHQVKTNREHTARSKAKRVGKKHEAHLDRIQAFPLPEPTKPKFKKKWASRPFPKKRKK